MNLYVGTSGFSYKEWHGAFYPEELTSVDLLAFYARRFSAVEINSSFYRIPAERVLEGWASATPPAFRFYLKASRRITHSGPLDQGGRDLGFLLHTARALGKRLGGILFQIPALQPRNMPQLETLLEMLPDGLHAAFEFKHRSWHDTRVFTALGLRDFAACISDTDQEQSPLISTASWGYLRMRRGGYSRKELTRWADWILQQKWKHCCVFFKHERNSGESPVLAQRFRDIVAQGE